MKKLLEEDDEESTICDDVCLEVVAAETRSKSTRDDEDEDEDDEYEEEEAESIRWTPRIHKRNESKYIQMKKFSIMDIFSLSMMSV